MSSLKTKIATAAVVGLFAGVSVALAGDWPQWRGPNHDGRSDETGFKTAWTGDLEIAWEREIGEAYSGITTTAGRVYTCGTMDGNQMLLCLDADSGKLLWKTAIEPAYKDSQGGGTRGTPTIHDGRVFIMGARGTVACMDARTGSSIWSRKYDNVPQWGYSGSILIEGGLAIVATGGSGGGLRALNAKDGKETWKCGGDGDSGYSTPYPFEFKGKKYVCGFLGNSLVIAEPATGRQVFDMPWKTDWKVNAATPIYHKGQLFITSGYKTGCGLFKLKAAGDRLELEEVWRNKALMNKFQSPVLHKGKLYSFDQKAFKCIDFKTGEQLWRERGKHGTVLFADGHLLALTQEGQLRVAPASSSGFEPTGESQILTDRCWTVPTLSNGRLYARNLKRIVCVDLRK